MDHEKIMNYTKISLISFCVLWLVVITGTESLSVEISTLSKEDALKKIPLRNLFPYVEKTVTRGTSSITYNKNKPHYTIKFLMQTFYKDILALHQESSKFAIEGRPINNQRSLLVGSLLEGCYKKSIPYEPNKPIEKLQFSNDGEKVAATSNNTIIIFNLSEEKSQFIDLPTRISSFSLNNELVILSLINKLSYLINIPKDGQYDKLKVKSREDMDPTLQTYFGPNQEIIEINDHEMRLTYLNDSLEKSTKFAFPENPLFHCVKQLCLVKPKECILIRDHDELGILFNSLRITGN